ncbi:replicative DNA helicase [Roseateles asaccharophilus]|uniref:DNA 5'-3' helicase n=1 Tax=Roseateles asaccharophilus TaxID=582607 RepID=A0ABU2A3M1_9BURK|nr:replicative DNA helicase [Roseateles asaccharophilus]MDR7331749.1 replicative DNA helicase [Roseateles asaccharophilus]
MSAIFGEDPRPVPSADAELQGLRVPPHSVEAEQSVLGGLLIDNRCWDRVGDLLKPDDFYRREHQVLFGAMSRLINASKPADVVTVFDALAEREQLAVGGLAYINALAQCVPSSANARRYAEIVRSRSVQRQVAALAVDLQGAVAGKLEAPEIMTAVDAAVTSLLKLMQGASSADEPVLLGDLMLELIDEVEALAAGKLPGISTGFIDLDALTAGGGRAGELWVMGARPSMGKSACAQTIGLNVAEDEWCLVLSQEDSLLTYGQRAVANLGKVNLADLRNPAKAEDPDALWAGLALGADKAGKKKLLVDAQGGLTLADVRRKVQQANRKIQSIQPGARLKVLLIDYLQLMTGENQNRNQLLGEISNGLKALVKEFGLWGILLSQLSREADKRAGLPHMSDLRDSGDIEGAADVIMLLHRQAKRKLTADNKYWAQAEICKNKNGPTDTISLFFHGKYQRFDNWAGPVPASAGGVGKGGDGAGERKGFN